MKRARWIGWALSLAVLVGSIGTAAAASAESPVLSRIVESGEFRVGMSGAQPPFNVKSKDGSLIGFEVDLARLLADAMGVKVKIVQHGDGMSRQVVNGLPEVCGPYTDP